MRQGPLSLLFAALLLSQPLQAEEAAPISPENTVPAIASPDATALAALEQRLAESEQQRAELASQLQNNAGERESAQLSRLRQENQRLKLQLNQALAEQPPQLLGEQQQWFAAGGGVGLLGVLLGVLLRGRRKARREWLN
ncbi:hypothetical protein D3880_14955 [Pseudomonas cavernae]|uniref:Translation initiation factor 2 n=1 Tax=Pseudomonas cavernae TaxID=2320867 RepID=A0A385Z4B4_9PSED|nr:hypothetical protein [Pseudomonas cavernae]AYC33574.1 hypothetical protein D3880_14955 [Pseudomonas cavernae]